MSLRRFILLFVAALVVIAGAIILSNQRYLEKDPRGGVFIADLNQRLDAITQIQIRKGATQPAVSLNRGRPGQWSIAQREGYPADVSKVRRLLLSLADAKIAEEKTDSPANYAVIGVEDPAAANAGGAEVTLAAPNLSAAVIIGHSSGNGTFARRGGEAKSYVIEPAITVETSPRDWIDTKLLDIPADRIRAVQVKLADGSAYSISRKSAKQPQDPKDKSSDEPKTVDFNLDRVPAGREAAEPSIVSPSSTSYSGVTADDVAAAKSIDFAKPATAQISLFDGSSYALTGTVTGDKHWITIAAPPADAALTAKARDRAFELSGYRYEAIFRPLEQLLKPKPATASTAGKSKRALKAKSAATP